MYHSIRWRLILSYAALTLLTILLIGIVAITLVTRYMADRERETLTLNAEAVARMARPILSSPGPIPRLQQLAITSGFLSNANLRILSSDRRVLVDSHAEQSEFGTLGIGERRSGTVRLLREGDTIFPFTVRLGPDAPIMFVFEDAHGDLHGAAAVMTVGREPGLWGNRLIFMESGDISSAVTGPPPSEDLHENDRLAHGFWNVVFGDTQAPAKVAAAAPVVTVPIRQSERVVGFVQMSNRYPLFAEPLRAIRRALFVAGLGAILVAVLLGYLMSRTLTAPLMTLQGAAQRMEEGDLTVRAPETGGEIGDLSRRFNRMAARLQATFADLAAERDALRRFIADASHELRTPLTALRQFVEILQGQAGGEPDTRADFLAESQRQLDRLQWITGHLLDLSRLDGGVASLDIARHDAADLLESALAPFRPLADEKEVELRLRIAEDLDAIDCDRASLEMALANLIDNALKHTPAGGTVELAASEEAGSAILAVSDTGPGIDPADRDRVFERFYRGQASGQQPGAGLGLAIVKSAAEAHGGSVRLEGDAGATFVIEIPSALA